MRVDDATGLLRGQILQVRRALMLVRHGGSRRRTHGYLLQSRPRTMSRRAEQSRADYDWWGGSRQSLTKCGATDADASVQSSPVQSSLVQLQTNRQPDRHRHRHRQAAVGVPAYVMSVVGCCDSQPGGMTIVSGSCGLRSFQLVRSIDCAVQSGQSDRDCDR